MNGPKIPKAEVREFYRETWEWLASSKSSRALGLLNDPALRQDEFERLIRRELNDDQAAIILEQRRLRVRAAKRFADPANWLWEAKMLEQASDERSSHLVASYFPKNVPVIDLCCGIGVDAVALSEASRPLTCVDLSDTAVQLTRYHLRNRKGCEVIQGQAGIGDSGDLIRPVIRLDSLRSRSTCLGDSFVPA